MPRASSRSVSSAPLVSALSWATSARSRCSSWPATDSARASLAAMASSCCCAPSWMSRSIRRRWSSCGGDDPQPRGLQLGQPGAELLGQADVAQQQAGLGREVAHELALDRREILPRPFGHRQRAERFALVVNKRDPVGPGDRGRPAAGEPDPGRWLALRGPAGPGGQLGAVFQPHHRTVGAGTLGQDPGHPREHVLGGVGPAHPPGELAERLIRGGPLAEHQPVGQPLHPFPDRLERHRHHRGGQDGQAQVRPRARQARNRIQGADPGHDQRRRPP